jgi:hypothetical protein
MTPAALGRLPGLRLMKNSQCPSRDRFGFVSSAAELTTGPRFTGNPQRSCTLVRCETKRSASPNPPGLFEAK